MASALRFLHIPTARTTEKCSRLPNNAACRRSVILGHSVNKRRQICRARAEAWKSWRIACKDDSVFDLQQSRDYSASLELVKKFYSLINRKDNLGLLELISDECLYEDLVFYSPFQGKEQVGKFLHELMDAMGPHVQFVVENVANGRNNSASVIWHLEWHGKRIPFTTGYSYFEFLEIGDNLFIGKIRGLEELPVKPGDLVLKLLKTATTLFDHYPSTTENLLSIPHDMKDIASVILHLFTDTHDPSDPHGRKL